MTADTARRSDRMIVAAAFSGFVAVGFNAGLLSVAWPSMRDSFGVSQDSIGVLLFTSTAGALVVNFGSGPIVSKIGLGSLLAAGSALGGLGYAGFASAPTWWLMVLTSLIASFGTASIVVGLNTYFAITKSARLMAWLQACFGLGATLSPTLLTRILKVGYTWRWGYGLMVFVYGGLCVFMLLSLRHWRLRPDGTEKEASLDHKRGRDTLRIPAMWLSILLFFTVTGVEGSTAQWPYTLFTEARAVEPQVAGLWVSLFWASMTLGRVFFGIVVDRVGAVRLVRLAMGGAVCSVALIWWNISASLSFLGLALAGLSLAPLFPVLTSNTPQRVGRDHSANAIGYQQAAVRLGLAVLPALAGVLVAQIGLEVIGPFLFVACGAMFLLHEATISRMKRPVGDASL